MSDPFSCVLGVDERWAVNRGCSLGTCRPRKASWCLARAFGGPGGLSRDWARNLSATYPLDTCQAPQTGPQGCQGSVLTAHRPVHATEWAAFHNKIKSLFGGLINLRLSPFFRLTSFLLFLCSVCTCSTCKGISMSDEWRHLMLLCPCKCPKESVDQPRPSL